MARWIVALAVLAVAVAFAGYWLSRAHLSLSSVPAGAEVHIDGRLVGRTPMDGQTLAPGLHQIELRHSHYAAYRRQINLPAGRRTALQIDLDPGVGELALYSNPRGAWVEVDGQRHEGTTPLLLRLPSGSHEVVMGMEERRAASAQVVVVADESRELRLELNIDPHGSLTVNTIPEDARVTLPDNLPEYRPGVRLPLGEYPVRVSRAGYETREQRLEVRYGDNRYSIQLPRAFATLTVSVVPSQGRVRVRFRERPGAALAWHDYRAGMKVPVGEVEVRASAMGRRSAYRRLNVTARGATLSLSLEAMSVKAGERLRDPLESGGRGPEMVVVPPGSFTMGSEAGSPSERPPRRIVLTEPFAVSVTEITAGDYRRFERASGRPVRDGEETAPDDVPASHMDFAGAVAYAAWMSAQTGYHYRLPSEAEWEYMARAGSATKYFFGDDATELCRYGNVADRSMSRHRVGFDVADCDDGFAELAPVASFPPNAFGVHDVMGNVAEWVMECGLPSYAEAPDDGSPVDAGVSCPTHGVRGGSWSDGVGGVRSASRSLASSASNSRGIRLLREL